MKKKRGGRGRETGIGSGPVFDGDITPEKMDSLLEFLPAFEQEGFWFGDMFYSPENVIVIGAFNFSAEAGTFIDQLYQDGWLFDFDWGKWQGRALDYYEHPEKLSRAGLKTIRKLLTVHVRKERFCDGHLKLVFESGHLTAILRRLKKIRQGQGRDPVKTVVFDEQIQTHRICWTIISTCPKCRNKYLRIFISRPTKEEIIGSCDNHHECTCNAYTTHKSKISD